MHWNRWLVIVVLSGIVMGMACGSDSPSGGNTRTERDGFISVRNDTTKGPITVVYQTPDGEAITTVIEIGEKKVVSGEEPVSGGSEAVVTVTGRSMSNQTTTMDIEVSVDGNMLVRILDIRSGQMDYDVMAG